MPNDNIWVQKADKMRLAQAAKAEHRKLVGMLRYLLDMYDRTTGVERAHILARAIPREQPKLPRELNINAT